MLKQRIIINDVDGFNDDNGSNSGALKFDLDDIFYLTFLQELLEN